MRRCAVSVASHAGLAAVGATAAASTFCVCAALVSISRLPTPSVKLTRTFSVRPTSAATGV